MLVLTEAAAAAGAALLLDERNVKAHYRCSTAFLGLGWMQEAGVLSAAASKNLSL